MSITLTDEARQIAALIEAETGATVRDCVVLDQDETAERVVAVIAAGEIARAIGRNGEQVERLEDRLGRPLRLVEDAPTAEGFVASALAPAAVYNVTISEADDRVAYAEVPEADKGVAIGPDGRTIAAARRLARRHHDIDDIQFA